MIKQKERKFWTYSIGDTVYAIDRWHDGEPTDYIAVRKEKIKGVSIELLEKGKTEIRYQFDGWYSSVKSNEVHADFDVLAEIVKKEWG